MERSHSLIRHSKGKIFSPKSKICINVQKNHKIFIYYYHLNVKNLWKFLIKMLFALEKIFTVWYNYLLLDND